MTRTLRRVLARRTARRVESHLQEASSYTCIVPTLGLFGDGRRSPVTSHERVVKFQERVNRDLAVPGARVNVTKDRTRLNVYATVRTPASH